MLWVVVLVIVLVVCLLVLQSKYQAEKREALLPNGGTVEVLVHREGVYPQTGPAFGLGGAFPMLVSALRNRGKRWAWAVTVRKQTAGVGMGYGSAIIHEVFPEQEVARNRAAQLATELSAGSVDLPLRD
jgi:hypothetical protein